MALMIATVYPDHSTVSPLYLKVTQVNENMRLITNTTGCMQKINYK